MGTGSNQLGGTPPEVPPVMPPNEMSDVRECSVWMDRLIDFPALKGGAIITSVTVPEDYLPFCLESFEALDSQGPAQKAKPWKPKITNKSLKQSGPLSKQSGPLKNKRKPSQRARI